MSAVISQILFIADLDILITGLGFLKLGLRTIITVPVGTGAPPSVLTPTGGAGLLIALDSTPLLEYSPYVGTMYRFFLS